MSSVININRRPLVLAGIELRGVDSSSRLWRSSGALFACPAALPGEATVEVGLARLNA
ncbi:hypothetical protein XACM_0576 [Xanthomonas euvesicatoria pv. citrumelo F1]|nr:hypothetical protein XACM_0576 [Xanthomonas euvesicatoria pv. citrumelo F1]